MSGPDQEEASPSKTQPLFAYAAAEVVRQRGGARGRGGPPDPGVSGLEETIVDLLQGRAFELYGEGLHQYLVLALGDVREARRVLDEVRHLVAGADRAVLTKPPGMRARLYRLARESARRRLEAGDGEGSRARGALPWRPPRAHRDRSYLAAIGGLREGSLGEEATELLELRHARELEPDELAFVVGADPETLRGALTAAEEGARRLFAPCREAMADGLVEAFALDAPTPSAPPPPAPSSGRGTVGPPLPAPPALPSGVASPAAPAAEPPSESGRPSLPSGAVIGGRYAVSERVGAGAFGEVYRAQDTEVAGHVVALKLLHQVAVSEEARAQGLRELRLIASVFHPSIVQFKDFGWHEGRLWFVMPWYEGETLEARIARSPLSRREARRIFEPLARALATMHEAGIRHQDVKPDNIFLARIRGFGGQEGDGILPVLLDLGVAATEAEMLLAGTPTYFAPEVAHLYAFLPDPPEIGPKADVFSLALSLRNALEPETQDDVPAGALEAFVKRRATKGPALPRRRELRYLRPVLRRWLAVDPSARPNAEELAEALAVLTEPEERRERRRRVLRWLVPLLLGLGVAFGAGAYALDARAKLKEQEAQEAADRAQLFEQRYQEVRARFQRKAFTADELLRELAGSEARGDALAQDLDETQKSLRRSRERRRELTREVYETNKRLADVRGELETTQGTLEETRGSLAERVRELDVAREQLAARSAELASATQTLDETRSTMAEVEAARQALDEQRRALQGQLAAAEEQVAAFEQRVDVLAGDKDRLEARVAELEAEAERLRRRGARGARPSAPAGTGTAGDVSDGASGPPTDAESPTGGDPASGAGAR
jgi:hypothetical protein